MEKFLNPMIPLSQLLLRLKTPIRKEEDASTLYWRGLCASMTYPKSSQAINKPKNHKNKTKRNPKPLNKYSQFKARSQKYKWKGKRRKRWRKGDVALWLPESFNAGHTIWMPMEVPDCPQLSQAFPYIPKNWKRKKVQEHRSLKSSKSP